MEKIYQLQNLLICNKYNFGLAIQSSPTIKYVFVRYENWATAKF